MPSIGIVATFVIVMCFLPICFDTQRAIAERRPWYGWAYALATLA
jgi:hypothetical protein